MNHRMTETGVVIEALPDFNFKVKLNQNDKEILAYLSGRMRQHRIRVLPGDKVIVEVTPYDERRGRIIRRL